MSVQIQENGLKVPPNQKLDVDKHVNEIFGQLALLGDNRRVRKKQCYLLNPIY